MGFPEPINSEVHGRHDQQIAQIYHLKNIYVVQINLFAFINMKTYKKREVHGIHEVQPGHHLDSQSKLGFVTDALLCDLHLIVFVQINLFRSHLPGMPPSSGPGWSPCKSHWC